jgi:hypothetical protein
VDLSDLRTSVRNIIGETTADFFGSDEVDTEINNAYRRFCAEERWPWLLTELDDSITSASDELTLPADVSLTKLFNLSISGGSLARPRVLERVDPAEGFRLRHQYTYYVGPPRWYYITRSNLAADEAPPTYYTAKFVPFPDADYTVEGQYLAVPVLLSGQSDEPMVPTEYQEAIVAYAAGKLFLKEFQISQKASEQFAIYAKILEQARVDMKQFDVDEIVAWGRKQPLRGYWGIETDPRFRTTPTLGG